MALVNHETKDVQFKIVYCGPSFAGKTVNLQHIHGRIDEERRGDLLQMAAGTDRKVFFEYLPVGAVLIKGYMTKFNLYTVPGASGVHATRQLILRGADAIVFVADSSPDKAEANQEAHRVLMESLNQNGTPLESLPLAVQCNKQDVPGARSVSEILRELEAGQGIGAVASQGFNVFATLNMVAEECLERFHASLIHKGDAANGHKVMEGKSQKTGGAR